MCFCFVILEETARLLTDLAAVETKKGMEITASTTLNKEREQVKHHFSLASNDSSFGAFECALGFVD